MSARDVLLNDVFSSPLFPPPDDYDAFADAGDAASIASSSSRYGEVSIRAPKNKDELEARKVFTRLYGHCMTEESRTSLKQFQSLFGLANRLPLLQGFVPAGGEKVLPSCYEYPKRENFGEVEEVGEGMTAENGADCSGGGGGGGEVGVAGVGGARAGKRRPSFMERLLGGRRRKSNGKSSDDGVALQVSLPQYRIE